MMRWEMKGEEETPEKRKQFDLKMCIASNTNYKKKSQKKDGTEKEIRKRRMRKKRVRERK